MGQFFVVAVMLGASLFATVLALYAWGRRDAPGATAFIWLLGAGGLWAIMSALHVATRDVTWSKLRFISIAGMPVIWTILTLQVTGRAHWISTRRLVALVAIPALTQLMIWTNPYRLMWNRYPFDLNAVAGMADVRFGPWFWVHSLYSYVLFLAGTLVLIWEFFRSSTLYRLQVGVMLLGTILPVGTTIAYTVGWVDPSEIDYTALAFILAGVPIAWSLFRYRMFDVVPVARDTLIDQMDDGMLVLDARDRIVDLNPAMRSILGHPARRILGQPLQVLQPLEEMLGRFEGVTDHQAEVVIVRDGEPCHYDLRISPLRDRQGRLTGRLIVLRDVTRLKQAEDSLRQTNVELEAHVEELDAFAHTVAHDLKTPLSSLLGYSDLLANDTARVSKENERFALQAIARNSEKMATIINELLLLASVRKTEEVELESLDMGGVVDEVRERLSYLIDEHEAHLDLPDAWPVALGRAAWVEEIWANYVSNAIKYGGSPPRVELGVTQGENGHVRFWVQDNGPGLDEEQQAQLFTEFTRLHRVRAEGHGLGLSIVQRIVEKLGGEVGVESEPGAGSRFWFTLPAERVE
jgi:PAS domain S-box-containing protein